jgi:hypothetical protein
MVVVVVVVVIIIIIIIIIISFLGGNYTCIPETTSKNEYQENSWG